MTPEITKHCISCGKDGHTYMECPTKPLGAMVAEAFGIPDILAPDHPTSSADDALREWQQKDTLWSHMRPNYAFLAGWVGRDPEVDSLRAELTTALAGHASRDTEVEALKGDAQLEAAKHDANDWRKRVIVERDAALDIIKSLEKGTETLRAEVETLRKERDEANKTVIECDYRSQVLSEIQLLTSQRDVLTAQLAEAKAEADNIIDTGHRYGHAGDTAMAVYLSATNEIDDKAEEIQALETSLTSAQTLAGELAGALEAACNAGDQVGGMDGSDDEPQAAFLRALTSGHQSLARYRAQQRPTGKEAEAGKETP